MITKVLEKLQAQKTEDLSNFLDEELNITRIKIYTELKKNNKGEFQQR